MTTHETQPETVNTTADVPAGAVPGSEPAFSDSAVSGDGQRHALAEQREPDGIDQDHGGHEPRAEASAVPQDHSGPAHASAAPSASSGSADQTLFGDGDLSGFRSRWTEVQAAFVDDPRDCVQKADGLVSDVVDRLTAGFSQARSGLEEQWSRGEQVSTEDLRLALQRYRDFFERLLAV
jgi:hypothetical protein